VRVRRSDGLPDCVDNGFGTFQCVMIPEANDAPALRMEISSSLPIGFFRVL
jgi:hypothetical protein